MPVNRQAALQLALLLLAVPTQYFITQFISSPDSGGRNLAFRRLTVSVFIPYMIHPNFMENLFDKIRPSAGSSHDFAGQDDPNGESPAVEVFQYKDRKGYFGSSPEPRTPRPGDVKFHIGQVIRHKRWKYRGVIIGWDYKARAPDEWLQMNHPPDKRHWRDMPNYSILVDTRDRLTPQVTYVPQENIEVVGNTQVMHPSVDNYFEYFDGAQYIPRPWLQALYPQD